MFIENLKLHLNLVKNKQYQTVTYWIVIQSSRLFQKPLKIDDYMVFYPMKFINSLLKIDQADSKILKPFIKRLNYFKNNTGQFGQYYYFLEIKLISINL